MSEIAKQPSVSTVVLRVILAAATQKGIAEQDVLEAAGLPTDIAESHSYVTQPQEEAVWGEVLRRLPLESFGLMAALTLRRGSFRALEYAVRTSDTFGDGLRRLAQFSRVLHGQRILALVDLEGQPAVRYHGPHRPVPLIDRCAAELALGAVVVLGRNATGVDFEPRRARFSHGAPADLALHRELFRCELAFDSEEDALVLDPALLGQVMPEADPELCSIMEEHLETELGAIDAPQSFAASTERAIAELLRQRCDASLDRMAERLDLSRRTIQSRLADEGVSYQQLLDNVRERLARSYLRRRELSMPGIALLLGYADVRSFHRAFRRWTNETPAAYRRRWHPARRDRPGP